MVSGLVTSPCDQLRIFSGEASEMRMESKSAIRLARSYGEERYIIISYFRLFAFIRGYLVCCQRGFQTLTRLLHQLHVQTQRLQLADQDVKAFRNAGFRGRLALDDGFVDLGAAVDVVRLGGKQLLQHVSRAVGFE